MTLPPPVEKALTMLKEAGYPAYAVGGCVRDRVLCMVPHDYDVCTAATPAQMQRVFAHERTLETGIRHGTLTVLLEGMPLEITTFRVDGEYLDGRHPAQVAFTARIEEDLARRDFTVNAMAYSPWDGLIDPFHGREDCAQGIIRCVGEAERRFDEDALRILRALRFSARLGFSIEKATAQAIHRLKGSLRKISKERIAAEMTGLLLGDFSQGVLTEFADVIFTLFPALAAMDTDRDGENAWRHALAALSLTPKDEALRWAALLHGCACPEPRGEEEGRHAKQSADTAERILRDLKASNALTAQVKTLVAWQAEPLREENIQEMLMRLGQETLEKLLRLRQADETAKAPQAGPEIQAAYQAMHNKMAALLAENACCTLGQLAVDGREIAALGFRGPAIGQTLQSLLEMVVRGQAENQKEALLAIARGRLCGSVTIPRL